MVGSSINNLALSIKAIWKVVHYTEPLLVHDVFTESVARGSFSQLPFDAVNLGALFVIGSGTKVGSRRVRWCFQVVITTT